MLERMQNIGDMHGTESLNDSNSVMHDTQTNTEANKTPENNQLPENKYSVRSLALTVVIILALALGIRFFIMAPYLVEGASMEESFHTFDYLMVDRLTYRFESPQRGDVIVLKFPLDPSRTFIKRIIGLPGETVSLHGQTVIVTNSEYPEGLVLDEPYISPTHASDTELSQTMGAGEYFVLGDNRKESADSRYWGSLPANAIVGRPLMRIYPFTSFAFFPGEARYMSNTADSLPIE